MLWTSHPFLIKLTATKIQNCWHQRNKKTYGFTCVIETFLQITTNIPRYLGSAFVHPFLWRHLVVLVKKKLKSRSIRKTKCCRWCTHQDSKCLHQSIVKMTNGTQQYLLNGSTKLTSSSSSMEQISFNRLQYFSLYPKGIRKRKNLKLKFAIQIQLQVATSMHRKQKKNKKESHWRQFAVVIHGMNRKKKKKW